MPLTTICGLGAYKMSLKVKENGVWSTVGKVRYTIAKDSDFSGPANNSGTKYIGESTNIVMPSRIGGVDFTKYNSLFSSSSYKKLAVISNNNGVTNMYYMFDNCSGLTELDLTAFDTSSVTDMDHMFGNCSGLTELDLTAFDTSSVTNMYYMFGFCSGLTELDLTAFDTSSVTDMDHMFGNCSGLTELDLTAFDTSSVTNMDRMFSNCSKLKTIYARTEADATKFRNSVSFPTGATVIVK